MKRLSSSLISALFFCMALTFGIRADEASYYINIPSGDLPEFLQYHPARIPLISHHRGGNVPGYPENAIETMAHALTYGPGLMEVDIAQLKDGTLILMHDDMLDRTTTGKGHISNSTWDYVKTLTLKDDEGTVTSYKVPLFKDVASWAKGKTILTLDIKRGTSFTKVSEIVKEVGAEDYMVGITYTLKQALAFHKIAPYMPLTISIRNEDELQAVKQSGIPSNMIIAWTGLEEKDAAFYDKLHAEGWKVELGTLGARGKSLDSKFAKSQDDAGYMKLLQKGVDIIATDRYQAVQKVIQAPNLYYFVRIPAKSVER